MWIYAHLWSGSRWGVMWASSRGPKELHKLGAENAAMLFVYPNKVCHRKWMLVDNLKPSIYTSLEGLPTHIVEDDKIAIWWATSRGMAIFLSGVLCLQNVLTVRLHSHGGHAIVDVWIAPSGHPIRSNAVDSTTWGDLDYLIPQCQSQTIHHTWGNDQHWSSSSFHTD